MVVINTSCCLPALEISAHSAGGVNVVSVVFFSQLNPDVNVFQRKFVNEVRRCEEMDRKLSEYMFVLLRLLPGNLSRQGLKNLRVEEKKRRIFVVP